jgi:hypothetical protein
VRLGIAEQRWHLNTSIRWILFVMLMLLGIGYIAAFVFFQEQSHDFIEVNESERALASSRNYPLTVPSTLFFNDAGDAVPLLGAGWYQPEAAGVWSGLANATLALNFRTRRDGVGVRINLNSFVVKRHRTRTITMTANGIMVGSWTRTPDNANEPLLATIPVSALHNGELLLRFHIDRPASPFALHVGPDLRSLGFLLRSIELFDP